MIMFVMKGSSLFRRVGLFMMAFAMGGAGLSALTLFAGIEGLTLPLKDLSLTALVGGCFYLIGVVADILIARKTRHS